MGSQEDVTLHHKLPPRKLKLMSEHLRSTFWTHLKQLSIELNIKQSGIIILH